MSTSSLHCILAEFPDETVLLHAARHVSASGFQRFDTFSPYPIHGMEKAMNIPASSIGWIVACGGAIGLSCAFALQTWISTAAYPMNIGGKPFFSYPVFVPICFEVMVLFSAFSAVFGMLYLNKLPRFHHPLFESARFSTVTSHGFFLAIEAGDPKFDNDRVIAMLAKIGGQHIEHIYE